MKKKTTLMAAAFAVCILGAGCMSSKEFVLRQNDLKAKQAWPATYQPVVIKGPVTIPEGGEMVVTVPNMPYQHTPIPDGQAIQASLAKDALHTAAIVGGAVYSIRKANTGGGDIHVTNNNAPAAGE